MINFSCSQCGLKFKVKEEFAGRSSRCPTCKQPLVVPDADRTQTLVPRGQIDGSSSSLVEAGVEGGITIAAEAAPGQKSVAELLAEGSRSRQRYLVEQEIARGGMGAVLRAVDRDIRREVAVKYMLGEPDRRKKLRFIEEAQITGQLEHPNIVPIHELAVDRQGRLFFAMKMVRGRSLSQVLKELRQHVPAPQKEYTPARLLNIFVNVCHGLAYAHARGVIHRDLKPANIMVGDFGEVYVMDWGLAKVRTEAAPSAIPVAVPVAAPANPFAFLDAPQASPASPSGSSSSGPTNKVVTSREAEADLTQEGAIMGTAQYMPPEQATGQVHALDARSDIYSLGAILYEMLTLQPAIEKAGDFRTTLRRVVEGKIVPPQERTPQRWIAPELAAIAMKALAKDPEARYPKVEALRQDIERFQEGRSVSAKEDTFRESVVKLLKRNQGASLATGIGLLLLAVVLGVGVNALNKARLRAESARAELLAEKEAKHVQAVKSVPAYLRAARMAVNERQFQDAMVQADTVLEYQPDQAEARLLKGEVLIVQRQYAAARAELERYLALRGKDAASREAFARELLRICNETREENPPQIAAFAFATAFTDEGAFALADGMMANIGFRNTAEARQKLLALYRQRLDKAWPGLGGRLGVGETGQFGLRLSHTQVADLTPLRGLPLSYLHLVACSEVRDLAPLQGMPLTYLEIVDCPQVRDLSPLKNMRLTHLQIGGQVEDLSPLWGMPLRELSINCERVRSLGPLKGMPLTTLTISHAQVTDLARLQGIPLKKLLLRDTPVRDLSPLRGMSLTELRCQGTHVADLSPLEGMPLRRLYCASSPVTDLTPLQGMSLVEIRFSPRQVTRGLKVIRAMKGLKTIGPDVEGPWFPAAEFWRKYDAGEFNK